MDSITPLFLRCGKFSNKGVVIKIDSGLWWVHQDLMTSVQNLRFYVPLCFKHNNRNPGGWSVLWKIQVHLLTKKCRCFMGSIWTLLLCLGEMILQHMFKNGKMYWWSHSSKGTMQEFLGESWCGSNYTRMFEIWKSQKGILEMNHPKTACRLLW